MKNWFARLLGGAPPTEADRPAPATAASLPQGDPATPAGFDLDLAFHRWLAGPAVHVGESKDALIQGELARLARDPQAAAGLVPRVPAVIPQLLRSLREEGTSARELARQVAQDVTLVAEVIREVNSPYYRPATPVRTIEGALMLLGQNGLRMLLARVAFRPVISAQPGRLARQAAPRLWRQSEKCALAASLAAPRYGADPFEACLAGLTRNVGLVVALRLIDQLDSAGRLPQSDSFACSLRDSARILSSRIATQWELPPPVGAAILQAGEAGGLPLAQALRMGERLATLRVLCEAGVEGAQDAVAGLAEDERRIFDKLGGMDA